MSLLTQTQVLIRGVQKYYANALDDEIHEDLILIFNDILKHAKEKYKDSIFLANIRSVETGSKIKNFIIKLDLLEDVLREKEDLEKPKE